MQYVVCGVGYTGRRVLDLLGSRDAFGLSRSPTEGLAARVTTVDLDDVTGPIAGLPDRYAMLYTVPPTAEDVPEPRLAQLFRGVTPGLSRFVYLSTSGVYGNRDGGIVSEADPPKPQTARARRRVGAERTCIDWCGDAGVPLYILRVAGIYGPGRLGLDRLRDGQPVIAAAESGPGNRVHVADLAAACVAALQGDAPPGIYNICDGDHRSATAFAKAVAGIAGLAAPVEISRAAAEESFSEARLSFLRESRRLDNRRMRQHLVPELRYPDAEAGIRASL